MDAAELKTLIFEAFKDVHKGGWVSIREAYAQDNRASIEDIEKARLADVEDNWWVLKPDNGSFETMLTFTNDEGVRFLLPAVMTGEIDGLDCGDRAYYKLCLDQWPYKTSPHWGYSESIEYMRGISPKNTAEYLKLSQKQIIAVAEFLKWFVPRYKPTLLESREIQLADIGRTHKVYEDMAAPQHYTMSLDEEVVKFDEEFRIFKDWMILGGVSF